MNWIAEGPFVQIMMMKMMMMMMRRRRMAMMMMMMMMLKVMSHFSHISIHALKIM